jgi:hypothetical protein
VFLSRQCSFPIFVFLPLHSESYTIFRMAEPIGVTSGLLAITIAAFNSCTLLYQEVKAFRGTEKNIRDLQAELGALREVLQNLKQSITDNTPGLADLEAPLRSCAELCSDFQVVVTKCTLHSGGGRTSVRDWAKIRFLGDDISGFKDLLARYKSTITIALCGANLYVSRSNFSHPQLTGHRIDAVSPPRPMPSRNITSLLLRRP